MTGCDEDGASSADGNGTTFEGNGSTAIEQRDGRKPSRVRGVDDASLWLRVLTGVAPVSQEFGRRRRKGSAHSSDLAEVRRLVGLHDAGNMAELNAALAEIDRDEFAKLFSMAIAHARANAVSSEAGVAKREHARSLRERGWTDAAISRHLHISTTRINQMLGSRAARAHAQG